MPTSATLRPFGVNIVIGVDVKYLRDAEQKNHIALPSVCLGTAFHGGTVLKTRASKHAIEQFFECWLSHYGAPELLLVDQGSEFQREFQETLEHYQIDTKVAGAHAPWQHGVVERHGSVVGTMWTTVVHQYGIVGHADAKMCWSVVLQAKNAIVTRNGMTPEQAVFGQSLRWPTLNRDDGGEPLVARGAEGEAYRTMQLRAAAKIALLSRDASDKMRRAVLRRSPPIRMELLPGTRVYFWAPNPMEGRRREDPHRWRGPATVIAK